jgi:hypothetical protein
MDDHEVAARFGAMILGGVLDESGDPPPEGSGLYDLIRLLDAEERGEITAEERYAEMRRLHPIPPFDPENELDPRHPAWRMRWGPVHREP